MKWDERGGVGAQGAPIAAIAVIARHRRDRKTKATFYRRGRKGTQRNCKCQKGPQSLNPTPIWDEVGWFGMNREGEGWRAKRGYRRNRRDRTSSPRSENKGHVLRQRT